MLPEAYVSHRAPRRLRLKVPSRKGDVNYFALLKQRLAGLHGLEALEAKPLTGSLLLLGRVSARAVADQGLAEELFTLEPPRRVRPPALPHMVAGGFNALDRQVRHATGGELDIASLSFTVLAVLGIRELLRGNLTAPAWYTAFWYAFNLFVKTHPDIRREEDQEVRETLSAFSA